ncbi:N-myc-interactor isoform X2 [Hemibagrus wyckioides]|uniref:N-myc-interactor isoform X2 n=1 Tax=Hemibagrus wyckioides TaxID=337641 RepID=UPI00266CB875|nr:N-myc-interactor isoform X2 [Hemibagrus wyckioides]
MMSGEQEQVNGEIVQSAKDQDLTKTREELEKLKKMVEAVEREKDKLILVKMDTDEAKKKAQLEVTNLMTAGEQLVASFNDKIKDIQAEVSTMTQTNQDLQKKLQQYKLQLKTKRTETDHLQQRFKIKAEIPEKRMRFTCIKNKEENEWAEEEEHEDQDIRAVFTIIQRPAFLLKGGEALITFEEEKVADQILRLPKCTVACDKTKSEVKPGTISLEPSAKFEVHITVSKRTIEFSNAFTLLPEERMRDRLELGFSKPSRGGGEVERVEYDMKNGAGRITFLKTGVAENLTLRGNFYIDAPSEMEVTVAPLYGYQLKKFQTFSGVPKRTVLLRGIQDISDEEDMQDHLEIHFQKPSNYGGEVESIKYISSGKKLKAFFNEDCVEAEA